MKKIGLVFILIISVGLYAQNAVGNINSHYSGMNLSFATVNIYKGDKLVATTLTDSHGDFDVKLEEVGEYTYEILYAGYEPITKTVYVGMEKNKEVLGLESSEEDREVSLKMEAYNVEKMKRADEIRSSAVRYSDNKVTKVWGLTDTEMPVTGKVTALEINDFSQWDYWKKLTDSGLSSYAGSWNIQPKGRYCVQVYNQDGLAVPNAIVTLWKGSEELFSSKTDNLGKAEVWASLLTRGETQKATQITIEYAGENAVITSPKPIEEGINYLEMKTDCPTLNEVEIAFVVDATGSMADELEYLKFDMVETIFQTQKINPKLLFRFGSVFYRDHGDAYITKKSDFTQVITENIAYINEQYADGGGDTPEAVDAALLEAIDGLHWSENTLTKILFLVLDAQPHTNYKIEEIIRKAAKKGIRIVPILGSGTERTNEYLMRALALGTNGTTISITNTSGIGGYKESPLTDTGVEESLVDLMTRIISSYVFVPDCEENFPTLDIVLPEDEVAISVNNEQKIVPTEEGTDHFSWSFAPNPTRGKIKIKASENIKTLNLLDISGKLLQVIEIKKEGKKLEVDLSAFPSGIYFLQAQIGTHKVTGKLIITH